MEPLNGILKMDDKRIIGKFVDGRKEGLHQDWHKNGQLKDKENYQDGKRVGKQESFYDDGKTSRIKIFKDGEIIFSEARNEDGLLISKWEKFVDDQGADCRISKNYFHKYSPVDRDQIASMDKSTPTSTVRKNFSRGERGRGFYMDYASWNTWELVDSAGTSHKVNVNEHDTSWDAKGEIIRIHHNNIQVYPIEEEVDNESSEDMNEKEEEETSYLYYVLIIIGLLILFRFLRKFYWK